MFLGQSTLKTSHAPRLIKSSSYPAILNNYKIHNSLYAAVHLWKTEAILQGHGLGIVPPVLEMGFPTGPRVPWFTKGAGHWAPETCLSLPSPVLFSDVPFYCGRLRVLISFHLEHVGRKLQVTRVLLSILTPWVHTELSLALSLSAI